MAFQPRTIKRKRVKNWLPAAVETARKKLLHHFFQPADGKGLFVKRFAHDHAA